MTSASPQAIWRYLSDLRTYREWGIWDDVSVECGEAASQPVGTVRRMRVGSRVVREEIIASERDKRLAYRLISGIPVRNYRAETLIQATDLGSEITWHASFSALIPFTGNAIVGQLAPLFETLLLLLAHQAEALTDTP